MLRLLALRRAFCTVAPKYKYRFEYGSYMQPHPEKVDKGGEDAIYTSSNLLFIADGVGGWSESGVDPALYSKRLAAIVEQLVNKDKQKYIDDPKLLIKQAVALNTEVGSTTVCLITLNPQNGIFKAYYIGDSVFALMKTPQKIRLARQQQYSFNFPYQVGTGAAQTQIGSYIELKPEDIQQGQIIVAATDGVWDNLFPEMIFQIVTQKPNTLADQAEQLACFSRIYGMTNDYESPFYLKAKQANIEYPRMGKLDDSSAIVARIIKQEL